MNLIPIDSLTDPRVADYANFRDHELLQRADPFDPDGHRGLFMAEGELVVRRLIASPFRTRSVFLTPTRLDTIRDALETLPPDVPVFIADQSVLNDIVGFNIHRGILAAGIRPPPTPLASLLERPGPFLILEDLFNHDNIGSIFRNAAALGGPGVTIILSPKTADPLYRKCFRVSTGHVLMIPYTRAETWPEALDLINASPGPTPASPAPSGGGGRVREAEVGAPLTQPSPIKLLALTPRPDAPSVSEVAETLARARHQGERTRFALMLGSEGPGLSDAALQRADTLVRIPMPPGPLGEVADSLNVAVTAAVALHRLVGSRL